MGIFQVSFNRAFNAIHLVVNIVSNYMRAMQLNCNADFPRDCNKNNCHMQK